MIPLPRRTPAPAVRDQERSAFSDVLDLLVHSVLGGVGAALVDSLGETVDYAGALEPFDAKVAAAHWQLVLACEEMRRFGGRRVVVRAARRGYVLAQAPDDYVLVLVTRPATAFAVTERALDATLRSLAREAGWNDGELARAGAGPWTRVDVRASGRTARPALVRLDRVWTEVEVLGAVVGLGRFERGFRVRAPRTGAELLVVREPSGFWYTDEIHEQR